MTRVLRYPFLSAVCCLSALACAVARDICVGEGLSGWARVLLVMTFVLLGLCFTLLSCRFFVDEGGVGVGFLLRVRRTSWDDLASMGVLSCNSRRTYLYGLRAMGVRRADEPEACPRGGRVLSAGDRLYARAENAFRQSPAPALASGGGLSADAHTGRGAGVLYRDDDAVPRQRAARRVFRYRVDAGGVRDVRGGSFPAEPRGGLCDGMPLHQ